MRFRRHVALTLALIGGPLAAVAGTCVAIDAAGVYGTPAIAGFNAYKARQYRYEQAGKAAAYDRAPRPTIFLGTSRVMYGLDPATWERLGGAPAYNLGGGSLGIAQMRAWVARARRLRPDLREVVMVTEYVLYQAGARRHAAEPLEADQPRWRAWARHGLTFTGLGDAWQTLRANRATPDRRAFSPDGRALDEPWIALLEEKGAGPSFAYGMARYRRFRPAPDRYAPASVADVAALAADCRAAGIAFTLVVPPGHALEEEFLRRIGAAPDVARWRRDLARAVPYWDFAGCGPVQAEPLAAHMRNFLDVVHFRPAVGDLMLARLRGAPGAPAGFGRFVDAGNVEVHLARLDAERAAWRKTRPPGLDLIDQP